MDSVTETILDEEVPQARLGLLLKHFSQRRAGKSLDPRE
jgi:hypothetical protein